MTVKELKEILDCCNEDAVVFVIDDATGAQILRDEHILHVAVENGATEVYIDLASKGVTR